jgi:hypothetical protein
VPISEIENEENLPCRFSGVKKAYFDEKSVLKGEWIGCQRYKTWSHEVYVGANGKKKNSFVQNVCQERLIKIAP